MWFRRIFNAKDNRKKPATSSKTRGARSEREGRATPELHLTARALRQLNRLQIVASRRLPGSTAGNRASVRRKPAAEFREHRMYAPGDDVRFVDWRASARQDHIFIKQGENPKEATIYVLIDCSASMVWGSPPKSYTALALAGAMSYMALSQGDRLVVVPLFASGGQNHIQPLGPLTGKGQFPVLLNYLRALPFRGQISLERALGVFSRRDASQGGRVILLSDLLENADLILNPVQSPANSSANNSLAKGLAHLPASQWDVSVFHLLHPEELQPTVRGEFDLMDIETRQMKHYVIHAKALETYQLHLQAWRAGVERTCHENKVTYTLIPTNWTLEDQILSHLREHNLVKPL